MKNLGREGRRGDRGLQVEEDVLFLLAGGDGDLLEPDDGGDLGARVLVLAGNSLSLLFVSAFGIGAGHSGEQWRSKEKKKYVTVGDASSEGLASAT